MVYSPQLEKITSSLVDIGDDARLWIFQSDRVLSKDEVSHIRSWLDDFTPRWTSHNRSLKAKSTIAFDRFIIIALDEQMSHAASGCSIDSLTHHIQAIGDKLSINMMDRVTFYFLLEDGVQGLHMNKVEEANKSGLISKDSLVFDNLIKTKKELHNQWIIPIGQSWQKRYL